MHQIDGSALAAVFESLPHPVIVCRAPSNAVADLAVVGCNPRGADLIANEAGYPTGDAIPQALAAWAHTPDARTIIDIARGVVEPGSVGATLIPLPEQQVAIVLDGPSVRRLRATCDRREALVQSADAQLEQFAYVVSHDLQTPIRTMVSYSQLLARRYAENLDERGRRYIAHIDEAADRLRTQMTDLLAFSRVDRLNDPAGDVELGPVVERVVMSLKGAIGQAEAEIDVGALPVAWGMSNLFELLVRELLDNALTFRAADRPCRVRIAGEATEAGCRLSISDDGIGIEPRYHEAVFEPMRRLMTIEADGTGMGLAVCRRIVHLHRGRIGIESTVGEGTTVIVELPGEG